MIVLHFIFVVEIELVLNTRTTIKKKKQKLEISLKENRIQECKRKAKELFLAIYNLQKKTFHFSL